MYVRAGISAVRMELLFVVPEIQAGQNKPVPPSSCSFSPPPPPLVARNIYCPSLTHGHETHTTTTSAFLCFKYTWLIWLECWCGYHESFKVPPVPSSTSSSATHTVILLKSLKLLLHSQGCSRQECCAFILPNCSVWKGTDTEWWRWCGGGCPSIKLATGVVTELDPHLCKRESRHIVVLHITPLNTEHWHAVMDLLYSYKAGYKRTIRHCQSHLTVIP